MGGAMLLGTARFDTESGSLLGAAGVEIRLGENEARLLGHLATRPGKAVIKDDLLGAVWPDVTVSEDSLFHAVAALRRTIGDERRRIIQTVPRRGYRLVPSAGGVTPARVIGQTTRLG